MDADLSARQLGILEFRREDIHWFAGETAP
jgi:hypothetical protein